MLHVINRRLIFGLVNVLHLVHRLPDLEETNRRVESVIEDVNQ